MGFGHHHSIIMPLQIYNTLNRRKEEFKPINPPKVNMYVCGVTVYDNCHLGHARALINFDVIYRYLRESGYQVNYVRNYTDVDDKIIARANKEKVAWNAVSEKYIASFNRDMGALGNQKPTIEPKATEHIDEMLAIIGKLEQKGYAYPAGGDVFYSVRKKADYGKLSGKKIEDLESGARIEIHEAKKDPLDFALWKQSKPGEPSWKSAWGEGRPGWHIECSAMSMKYLGETLDIHGGGRDLSFPHHENEIAQSEAATDKQFAKYWIHNGFVNINAEKMSKSLGNFLTIENLLKSTDPEVVRLFVLAAHYRSPLDYTEQNIEATRSSLLRWYTTLARLHSSLAIEGKASKVTEALRQKIAAFDSDFKLAMDDDFNTAKVVGILFDLARELNKVLDENRALPQDLSKAFLTSIEKVHRVFGLFGSDPFGFLENDKSLKLGQNSFSADEIEVKIQQRRDAKKSKDFKTADLIRDELVKAGVQLKDNPDGTTTWSIG